MASISVGEFFKRNLIGMILFTIVTGVAANYIWERVKTQPKTELKAEPPHQRQPKSEVGAVLDACDRVPPNVARFVVIPTIPSGVQVPEYTLRFQGALGDKVAVTRYAVLNEGLEKGALKIYRGKYTLVLADPVTTDTIASLSSTGVNAYDIEKRSVDQVLIGFWPDSKAPAQLTWTDRPLSPALSGRCNLLNLVILTR